MAVSSSDPAPVRWLSSSAPKASPPAWAEVTAPWPMKKDDVCHDLPMKKWIKMVLYHSLEVLETCFCSPKMSETCVQRVFGQVVVSVCTTHLPGNDTTRDGQSDTNRPRTRREHDIKLQLLRLLEKSLGFDNVWYIAGCRGKSYLLQPEIMLCHPAERQLSWCYWCWSFSPNLLLGAEGMSSGLGSCYSLRFGYTNCGCVWKMMEKWLPQNHALSLVTEMSEN